MSTKANRTARINKGIKREHNHVTIGKTGYIPTGTNTAINLKLAKRK